MERYWTLRSCTQRKAKSAFLQICVTEKEKKSVEGQTLFFSLEIASYCSESFGYIKLLRILDFAMKLVYYHVAQEIDGESFIAITVPVYARVFTKFTYLACILGATRSFSKYNYYNHGSSL